MNFCLHARCYGIEYIGVISFLVLVETNYYLLLISIHCLRISASVEGNCEGS